MKNYYNVVRQIMIENPKTQDDDMFLYSVFCAKFCLVKYDETFYQVMLTAKSRGLPSYESISRARRKVQENEPALSGKRRNQRKKEEKAYREWYRLN